MMLKRVPKRPEVSRSEARQNKLLPIRKFNKPSGKSPLQMLQLSQNEIKKLKQSPSKVQSIYA